MLIQKILFLSVLATVIACIEIEVEGKHGWAEKLSTWYRTTGLAARLFATFMGGRPLTGYHLFMLPLSVLILHTPYFLGAPQSVPWTITGELLTLAMAALFAVQWDYLWFVLNPHYSWRWRKDAIWWHARTPWVFGLFPLDYLMGPVLSIVFACIAAHLAHTQVLLTSHLWLMLGLATYTLIIKIASPLYHHWYAHMRTRDDREKAGIHHND